MLREFSLKTKAGHWEELSTWHSTTICSQPGLDPPRNKSWKRWALQVRQTGGQKGEEWIPWNVLQTQPGPLAVEITTIPKWGQEHTQTYTHTHKTQAHTCFFYLKAERGRGIKEKMDNYNCQNLGRPDSWLSLLNPASYFFLTSRHQSWS